VAGEGAAEFGRIAQGRGEHQPETEFQAGLRKFSMLLVQVAGVLTGTATGLRGSVSSSSTRSRRPCRLENADSVTLSRDRQADTVSLPAADQESGPLI